MRQTIGDYIINLLGAEVTGKPGEYIADCPNCGKENHFGFNIDSGVGHCWICGYAVNTITLIMDVEGINYPRALQRMAELRKVIRSTPKDTKFVQALQALLTVERNVEVAGTEIKLPDGLVSITDVVALPGMVYLNGRGFSAQVCERFGLLYMPYGEGEERRFWRHIFFPSYTRDGLLSYWTTRAAYEPKRGSKSYNVPGPKGATLYGTHVARQADCILVEGPLDTLSVYPCGVGVLGRVLTQWQISELTKRYRTITVCFDSDAGEQTMEAARRLRAAGCNRVYIGRPVGDDPADGLSATGTSVRNATAILNGRVPYSVAENLTQKIAGFF